MTYVLGMHDNQKCLKLVSEKGVGPTGLSKAGLEALTETACANLGYPLMSSSGRPSSSPAQELEGWFT